MRQGRNGGKLKSGNTVNVGRKPNLPPLDELLGDLLNEPTKDELNKAKKLLNVIWAKAEKGDLKAAEILLDRAYGKAKQHIQHEGEINTTPTPINITVHKSNE